MRFLAAVLLVTFVAGCATPAAPKTGPAASAPVAGWTLDCALGAAEKTINASWRQTCEARASHNPGPKEETWLEINPTDPKNVVVGAKDLDPANSNHCVWNGVFVTHDGGASWKDVVIGGKFADRKPGDPAYGYACNTDPDFQFTKDGALHYGVEMYDATRGLTPSDSNLPVKPPSEGYKILLATSHDGGDTWPDMITFQQDLVVTTDYSRMTVNPGSQAILESIGSVAGGCHVLVSKDGGKTATMFNAATKDGIPCSSNNGAIAVSPKGTVIIVGNGIAARSTDDGATWLDSNPIFTFKRVAGKFAESKYRTGSELEIAYDLTQGARKGTLYSVYASADRDEADVFSRSSTDDGKTWSEPVIVNDDPAGPHQWMPNLAVAGDGSVHAFFMDKRYDAGHALIDITHAVSTDGAKTWTNERVSTVSYDGDLGVHQDGFPFIGDYLGVAALGDDVWAGFPDASDGVTTVVAAAHVHRSA